MADGRLSCRIALYARKPMEAALENDEITSPIQARGNRGEPGFNTELNAKRGKEVPIKLLALSANYYTPMESLVLSEAKLKGAYL